MASAVPSAHDRGGGPNSAWFAGIWVALRKALRKPQFWFGVRILVPALVWYWVFSFRPILRALQLAVVRYDLLDPADSPFVGVDNFRQLLDNPLFLVSVRNTLTWAILSCGLMLPISMMIALLLANVKRGRNTYQALVFIPVVVSLVAVSLLFRMLMDPEVGQFNQILRGLGLPESKWLASDRTALPSAVVISVWKGMGFYVVILTAGMLSIPNELYDAAVVDGVNERQRFWRITLPLLAHTIVLVTVLLAIGTLQEFTLPHVLTRGGPANATFLYNLLLYQEAFVDIRFGTATAAALLQFVFIVFVSYLQLKLIRPDWEY
jgi:ABC-type sugar transport system permease subunit